MGATTGPPGLPKQPLVSSLRLGVGPGTPFPHGRAWLPNSNLLPWLPAPSRHPAQRAPGPSTAALLPGERGAWERQREGKRGGGGLRQGRGGQHSRRS